MSKLDFAYWDAVPEGPPDYSPAEVYEMHIELVQKLEQLGWHSYFTIEHQNRPGANITCPSVYLTAVARATSAIRIGTMMWQLPFYHPLRLAQEVAMLDHLSHGRVEFGTGIGVHEHEFIRWGVDYYQRAAISGEVIDIVKQAWTQPEVTYDGKYFHFDEALPNPQPYQKPYPPIWAAVHSEESMRFAARNNYNVAQNIDVDEDVARKFDLFRQTWEECGHEGPKPRVFLQRVVHVAETDEKAHAQARQYIGGGQSRRVGGQGIGATRVGWGSHARGMGRDSERPDDKRRGEMIAQAENDYDFNIEHGLAVVGSPKTVIERLEEGKEKIGYDLFCTDFIWRMPKEQLNESLELFGREVIPAFK